MLNFNTIVFPVDFSDRCRGAAHYVEALAGRFSSRLILLHVLETTIGQPGDLDFGGLAASLQWEDRVERAQAMLDGFLKEELGYLNVERRLETGDPSRRIVTVAQEEHADLIMLPTHGYGGFRRFILGSVTAKVLHDADCPVWTGVHMEAAPPLDSIAVKTVMCSIDLTAKCESILAAGMQFAEEYDAQLVLAHVVPGSEAIPEKLLDCELRRHLLAQAREQLLALAATAGAKATLAVESGDVAETIDRMAKAHNADLLVIGRSHHAGFGRLRTYSYAIIRQSPCPVLSL
jgi:nucleotide-binding universal stress UspA family protein